MLVRHANARAGARASPRRPSQRPARVVLARSGPDSKLTSEVAETNGVAKDLLPKLDSEAAKSSTEGNQLMRWASDLGSKAQQALAGLQKSIQNSPEAPADSGAKPAAAAAEADISATITKLEQATAAIRDSAAVADALEAGAALLEKAEAEAAKEAAAVIAAVEGAAAEAVAAASEAASEIIAAAETAAEGAVAAAAAEAKGEAPAAPAAAGAVKVEIAVKRETQPGQDVWVVGSLPALGEWSLDAALPLAWTEGHVWRATIEVDPSETAHIEYKAVLKCPDSVIWEGGDNKTADLAAGSEPVELFHEFSD
ncbi:hypothetical protein Rsub_07222 [Raphidocelis subcapitata]|uniref:CBM20 domain-containing protein n=1 Tax=Raphidocelis subcapitata TaxID=307507 RepID=A0A2V0P3H0_9CHLO|nr:hypothetical protein Rsub_07222 [Raphidocelis subcapitata]|eukprot:GBF94408.1 hypothetical protein Rsub_07222 [Raphidocelis subcapitata]